MSIIYGNIPKMLCTYVLCKGVDNFKVQQIIFDNFNILNDIFHLFHELN